MLKTRNYSTAVLLCIVAYVHCCTRVSNVVKQWNGGFHGEINVPVTSAINTWSARITFEHPVSKLETWTATAQQENDKTFVLKPVQWNSNVGSGANLQIAFVAHFSDNGSGTNPCLTFFAGQSEPGSDGGNQGNNGGNQGNNGGSDAGGNQGNNGGSDVGGKPAGGGSNGEDAGKQATPNTKYNYDDALHKALLFFEAQRSGKLPADKMIDWRGDSGLDDGKDVGKDLTGGWHDAGDHVKFGLPMAASATMLLYGLEFLKQGYQYAGQYAMGRRQVKWALDYFLKCAVDKDRLYVQVADGDADHGWWGRPEDNFQFRPAFWIGAGKPKGGADVAGETAAALAAGSVVFKDDADYSSRLLSNAKSVYELAKANPGIQNLVIPNIVKFYNSDEYRDELAQAAAWIAYAVGKSSSEYQKYLDEAKGFLNQLGNGIPWSQSWSEKRPATNFLMYTLTGDESYKQRLEDFLKDWRPGGSIPRTPQGLAWRDKWGSNRYAANAACVALLAAKAGINSKANYDFAASQINFMLGDGGRSYLVGFGNNYPQRAHHKAASCPYKPAGCGWDQLHTSNPNPHVLNGALVGGPGELSGNFVDDRGKFEFTEVATDYNAGFTSALAGMKYFAVNPAK